MSEDRQFLAALTGEQQALWHRLNEFQWNPNSAEKPFAGRLTAEMGWTAEFTERVLQEYLRFVFLTAIAGHAVCPSEDVDAVWHQHLTYSRSYWEDLCQKTLRSNLHHNPTAGGTAELQKHWEMYRQTLLSYRRVFGTSPPGDIWPPAFERFDPQSRVRIVNARDHWIIRKPGWWPRSLRHRRLALAFVPVMAAGLGPFDWAGPEFLGLYAILYVILLIGSLNFRRYQRDVPTVGDPELTAEEIACLSFGRPAAVNVTVARMLQAQQLISKPYKGWLISSNGARVMFSAGENVPEADDKFATVIYASVQASDRTLVELHAILAQETEAIDERLQAYGYVVDSERQFSARVVPFLVMVLLLIMGSVKVMIGIERMRAVELLVACCVVTLITALAMLTSVRRSLSGDRLLESLKSLHSNLKSGGPANLSHHDVALSAALFGATALHGPAFDDLKTAWKAATHGGGSGSGGCSGVGCGGGGGGGGGCGGGGCGGGGGGCGGCS